MGLTRPRHGTRRARLALDKLRRQGGFNRQGPGRHHAEQAPAGSSAPRWRTLEYLHQGRRLPASRFNIPISNSPLSLLFQPEYGSEAGAPCFAEVYGLLDDCAERQTAHGFIHGLSLGALNSEKSAGAVRDDRRSR